MFVTEIAGKQFILEKDDIIAVFRVKGEPGAEVVSERVLLKAEGGEVAVGRPYIEGAKVVFSIIKQTLGPKVRGMKFHRLSNYKRIFGHRDRLTYLKVISLTEGQG